MNIVFVLDYISASSSFNHHDINLWIASNSDHGTDPHWSRSWSLWVIAEHHGPLKKSKNRKEDGNKARKKENGSNESARESNKNKTKKESGRNKSKSDTSSGKSFRRIKRIIRLFKKACLSYFRRSLCWYMAFISWKEWESFCLTSHKALT